MLIERSVHHGGAKMEKKKKKFAVPHVYVLLMAIIVFFAILSYIIPAGQYDYTTLESGR